MMAQISPGTPSGLKTSCFTPIRTYTGEFDSATFQSTKRYQTHERYSKDTDAKDIRKHVIEFKGSFWNQNLKKLT